MAKKFGYKKYLKPKRVQKDMSTLKVFICSFVLMLVVFTVCINCFAPEVDVSIGESSPEVVEQENNIYIKKYVDDRLLAIQQEDQAEEVKSQQLKTAEKSNKIVESLNEPEEQPELKPIELVASIPEIKVSHPKVAAPVPQPVTPEVTVTYRVYIGHYSTYDQVKIAKDIVNETDPELNAVIKQLNSGYTLQAGVFKNKEAATSLTNTLLKEHLPARMVIE